nr:FAD-dependent oxidoreductase [Acanthopleuribacter pedis]
MVLIGNGNAGMKALHALFDIAPEQYDIRVFGAEPHLPYDRNTLSSVLADEKQVDDLHLYQPEWYASHGIQMHLGTEITQIDREQRKVHTKTGEVFDYDRLLIGTGSKSNVLPLPGKDLRGVMTFRQIEDVNNLLARAQVAHHAVVLGGGLQSLEIACGLRRRGLDVTVVYRGDTLMEDQLDAEGGVMLQRTMEGLGINFLGSAEAVSLNDDGRGNVNGVSLDYGRTVGADLVVMAVGIQPNIGIAQACGLKCEQGVVVDDRLVTSDDHIYAIGECAQYPNQGVGHIAPIMEIARLWAQHMAGSGCEQKPVLAAAHGETHSELGDMDLYAIGHTHDNEEVTPLVSRDSVMNIYKKLMVRDGFLVGAILLGDTTDADWYRHLVRGHIDVSAIMDKLPGGQQALRDAGFDESSPYFPTAAVS